MLAVGGQEHSHPSVLRWHWLSNREGITTAQQFPKFIFANHAGVTAEGWAELVK